MSKLHRLVGQPLKNVKGAFKQDSIIKSIILGVLFVVLFFDFAIGANPLRYTLVAGDIATEDIYAPSNMVDKAATEQKKREAEANVQPVYQHDLTVQIDITEKIDKFFEGLDAVRKDESLELTKKLEYLAQRANIALSQEKYAMLLRAKSEDISRLRLNISYIVNQVLGQRITEDQLDLNRQIIRDFFANKTEANTLNEVGSDIAVIIIKPNLFFDREATDENSIAARENVEDIVIKKGAIIVNKGKEVTFHQISLLDAYGLLDNGRNMLDIGVYAGYVIIIGIGIFMLGLYLSLYDKRIWNNNNSLILLCLIIAIAIAFSTVVRFISIYFIILPAFVMILSIMLNPKAAIMSNIVMTVLVGYITALDLSVLVIMLLSGILGAIMVYKTNHRSTIVYSGLAISAMSVLIILSFGLQTHIELRDLLKDVLFGIGGGIFSSILTIGILPFLETVFDIITPIKLLELSNPNQPLMRRLLIEAPGTYYHSILVGNLAEAAAEDVDANSLLCRIGAYYHDIGKLKRPYFFKENQITKDNPHDKITPNLSALIVTSHVKDGVDLARKHKLPSSVVNIIKEHHGNTLVAYFYHKAMNSDGSEQVTEDKFRYQFSKPQTKEAAIVMLADSVEAYIRSLSEPTQEQVDKGVRKIIKEKLQDGQLENCELTLKDMENIAKAFVKVLAGIFHDRIEYPDNIKDI